MNTNLQNPAHLKYRPDIDGLRAVAVISVVFFHTYPNLLQGGFTGVDVFFVISGFLISTNIFKDLSNNTFSFKDFYARRIKRIYPSLLVVLGSLYLFGWFALFNEEFMQLGKHIAATAAFVSNLVYWNEAGYFDSSAELKPLLNMWSLGVEEQYYIVWPMIVWAAYKQNSKILLLSLALAAISFATNIYQSHSDLTADFYSPFTRFWELLAGSILAWLYPNICSKQQTRVVSNTARNTISILGASLILASIIFLNNQLPFPGKWAVIPVLGSLLLIYVGPNAIVNYRLLGNSAMVWIGKISYPIYLWHWPLISIVYILESGNPSRLQRLGAIVLSVILSWVTYRYFERPLRFGSGKKTTVTLFVFMAVIGIAGWLTYSSEGFSFRQINSHKGSNSFDTPYRESCSPMLGSHKDSNDWCNKGTALVRLPNAALIGDSFSNSYSPMLLEFSNSNPLGFSFVQLGHGSCPPLMNFGPQQCKDAADAYFKYVSDNRSIATVILSANWPTYLSEDVMNWSNGIENADAALSALESTIVKYQSLNKKVLVFLSPPQGFSPKSCIARPFSMRSKQCNLLKSEAIQNDKGYREKMLALLDRLSIDYFDPYTYFCNEDFCNVESNGEIFSIDGHLLSVLGGVYLATKGKSRLNSLLINSSYH